MPSDEGRPAHVEIESVALEVVTDWYEGNRKKSGFPHCKVRTPEERGHPNLAMRGNGFNAAGGRRKGPSSRTSAARGPVLTNAATRGADLTNVFRPIFREFGRPCAKRS